MNVHRARRRHTDLVVGGAQSDDGSERAGQEADHPAGRGQATPAATQGARCVGRFAVTLNDIQSLVTGVGCGRLSQQWFQSLRSRFARLGTFGSLNLAFRILAGRFGATPFDRCLQVPSEGEMQHDDDRAESQFPAPTQGKMSH